AKKYQLIIHSINNGYSISGVDLGSDSLQVLTQPKPLLLTGPGTSSYDTGELWYTIDQQLHMQLTQAKIHDFPQLKLANYSHLIMANGSYKALDEKQVESIKDWVIDGGVLIAMKSASKWVTDNKLLEVNFNQDEKSNKGPAKKRRAYAEMVKDDAQQVIGGSIFSTTIDLTHPLTFGYQRESLPVFKNHSLIMEPSSNPYATIVRYNNEPLLSGFVSNENLEKIANSAMMIAERKGKGSIILILDNPVFRGYWYGSSRLFINSLFFGTSFRNPAN
ncbi:MAG: zinc carboxypeptidase, partial [Gammaproteobacteria bacterium]|nr:zinc carboxypeptidase [Gammaproteobacteria bacterium]